MTDDSTVSSDYGWYGDDLTGATDTLATIALRGHRAFLFLDIPSPAQLAAAGPLDAVGIAGAARSMNPDEMAQVLPPVGRFFRDLGVRLLHYKCCSTFDSAPRVGNLAAAIAALRPFADNSTVPLIGGQPSLGRYCVFSTLFATAGDSVYRIDRHPTMSRHPATPMTEADLTRHLAALGLADVAAIHWPSVTRTALERAWREASNTNAPAILIDVVDESHIEAIGGLLRNLFRGRTTLAVGASSVAEAWFAQPPSELEHTADMGDGPVFGFVGSLSPVTRGQVAAAKSYAVLEISPGDVAADSARRSAVIEQAVSGLMEGRHVLISTAPLAGDVPSASDFGLARASAALIDDVLRRSGVRRLAIAGGDTSTIAATSLGFWGLGYHGLAARGVAVCRGRSAEASRDGMLLLLKGGQMGPERIFETFAASPKQGAPRPEPAPAQ